MATISDKLIQLKNIKQDIKEATNNLGGNVGDDFSTYAEAINRFATYENPNFYADRTAGGTNFDYMFYGYNGSDIDVSNWDTSRGTSAQHCFRECKKSLDISNWDLSSLTNAYYMFYGFTNNNKYFDLSVFDFSNVSNVKYMFSNSNTDYLDVRNINLTGATDYSNLFDSCSGTELDLSNWDINNVTNLYYTFSGSKHKKIDLTGWKTTNVKNFGGVFAGYGGITTHLIIPDWDMTNATSTGNMFPTSSSYFKFKYIDLSRSNDITINKIASFLLAKTATTYGEILIPADTSQDVINALIAKYWKPIGPKLDLISTELLFELDEIKPGKTTKVCAGNSNPWYGDDRLETIEFISSDESVATVSGKEITGVTEGTTEITAVRRENGVVVSTAPTTLTVSETDSKPNLIKFRTNGRESTYSFLVVNGKSLSKSNLTYDSITNMYSYDPGTQITKIRFANGGDPYNAINEIIKFNFNATSITDATDIFRNCMLTVLDLSDWDTSRITSMQSMLGYCTELTTIIGDIDLSNLSSGFSGTYDKGIAYSLFCECYKLEHVSFVNIYKDCDMMNIEDPVRTNSRWSINLSHTIIKDECLIQIISELPNLYDKNADDIDKIYLTLPPTNTLTEEQVQPAIDKGWTVANVNY